VNNHSWGEQNNVDQYTGANHLNNQYSGGYHNDVSETDNKHESRAPEIKKQETKKPEVKKENLRHDYMRRPKYVPNIERENVDIGKVIREYYVDREKVNYSSFSSISLHQISSLLPFASSLFLEGRDYSISKKYLWEHPNITFCQRFNFGGDFEEIWNK
jgi:hypothetical protein